jgi:hypothetical protein
MSRLRHLDASSAVRPCLRDRRWDRSPLGWSQAPPNPRHFDVTRIVRRDLALSAGALPRSCRVSSPVRLSCQPVRDRRGSSTRRRRRSPRHHALPRSAPERTVIEERRRRPGIAMAQDARKRPTGPFVVHDLLESRELDPPKSIPVGIGERATTGERVGKAVPGNDHQAHRVGRREARWD